MDFLARGNRGHTELLIPPEVSGLTFILHTPHERFSSTAT